MELWDREERIGLVETEGKGKCHERNGTWHFRDGMKVLAL